jgi:heme exporter protein B
MSTTDRSGWSAVLADAARITAKDLRVEARSKEVLLTMGYFGLLVVLLFSFSFFRGDAPLAPVAAGILWVAIAFSGTLGLGRIFEREREGDCLRALLLTPVARPAIYLGKAAGVFLFMLLVEAVVVPAVVLFFSLDLDAATAGALATTVLLGTVGYAAVGTVLAAMLVRARSRDVLLAVVLYPLILPVLIAGVKATAGLLEGGPDGAEVGIWMRLLATFDIVFLVAGLWLFEPMLVD